MKKTMILLLLFLIPSLAYAHDKDMRGSCCPGMMMGQNRMGSAMTGRARYEKSDMEMKFMFKVRYLMENAEKLGLSEEQIQNIKQIKIRVLKSALMKEAEIKSLKLDLWETLGKDSADTKSFNEIIDKKYEIKKQLAQDLFKGIVDVKNVLSKDQQKKMKEMLKQGGCGKAEEEMEEKHESQDKEE